MLKKSVIAAVLAIAGMQAISAIAATPAAVPVTEAAKSPLGYNAVGFTDRDFAGMAETQQGIYFRMRYKFDENSF